MKNRSKNKKKQWKHLLKGFNSELNALKEKELISAGQFVIQKREKLMVQKGDKDSAKDHPELPTASTKSKKQPYRKGKVNIFCKAVDLWADGQESPAAPVPNKPKLDSEPVCFAGQSYNPSAIDHQLLLMHVAKEEQKREKRENLHKISKRQIKRPKKSNKPLPINKVKKRTPRQLAKKMQTDLDNIPKILKELKKEEKESILRVTKRNALAAIQKEDKKPKFPTSFQLPGELSTNLRKLKVDRSWMHEVEFKRNKLPRARKSLNLKKGTKSYVRRK